MTTTHQQVKPALLPLHCGSRSSVATSRCSHEANTAGFILGGLLVVVVVLSIVMQAINSLIWQLSYWSAAGRPILLLPVGALVLALLPQWSHRSVASEVKRQ